MYFHACCQGIIGGNKLAESPLDVMRSRYTAHVIHDMAHIKRTMQGKALKLFDEVKTYDEWFMLSVWNKLEIIDSQPVRSQDKNGFVEFKAYYTFQNQEHVLHERSKFQKNANQWYYVSGQQKGAHIESSDKVGRNELCTCGSGKKSKKCCA